MMIEKEPSTWCWIDVRDPLETNRKIWVHAECTRFLVLFALVTQKQETRALSPLPWSASYRPAPRGVVCIVRLRSAESLATVSSVLLWISFRRKPARPPFLLVSTHFHVRAVHRGQKKRKKYLLLFSYLIRPFRPSGAFHSRRIRIKAERGLCCMLAYFIYLCSIRLFSFF
jgi:hypothetical protein